MCGQTGQERLIIQKGRMHPCAKHTAFAQSGEHMAGNIRCAGNGGGKKKHRREPTGERRRRKAGGRERRERMTGSHQTGDDGVRTNGLAFAQIAPRVVIPSAAADEQKKTSGHAGCKRHHARLERTDKCVILGQDGGKRIGQVAEEQERICRVPRGAEHAHQVGNIARVTRRGENDAQKILFQNACLRQPCS